MDAHTNSVVSHALRHEEALSDGAAAEGSDDPERLLIPESPVLRIDQGEVRVTGARRRS